MPWTNALFDFAAGWCAWSLAHNLGHRWWHNDMKQGRQTFYAHGEREHHRIYDRHGDHRIHLAEDPRELFISFPFAVVGPVALVFVAAFGWLRGWPDCSTLRRRPLLLHAPRSPPAYPVSPHRRPARHPRPSPADASPPPPDPRPQFLLRLRPPLGPPLRHRHSPAAARPRDRSPRRAPVAWASGLRRASLARPAPFRPLP